MLGVGVRTLDCYDFLEVLGLVLGSVGCRVWAV